MGSNGKCGRESFDTPPLKHCGPPVASMFTSWVEPIRRASCHLRGNRIAALPDGFRDLLSLEVLETEGNYPKLTVLQVPPRLSRVTF